MTLSYFDARCTSLKIPGRHDHRWCVQPRLQTTASNTHRPTGRRLYL